MKDASNPIFSKTTKPTTMNQIISTLEQIVLDSENNQDSLGYFTALYLKVTKKVKEGIDDNFFDDGPRMEKLDVVFANRYLDAYFAYKENETITESWQRAFKLSTKYWPIVLQHLLVGMNAHINLDLGIAAAHIMKGKNIEDLENDFNKINDILSSLVVGVEKDLGEIWPALKIILKVTGKFDDFLVNFSMKIARNGAWKFTTSIVNKPPEVLKELIEARDQKAAKKAKIIANPGIVAGTIFGIIRLGEQGSVTKKIEKLIA
jgi:hypothetical protein